MSSALPVHYNVGALFLAGRQVGTLQGVDVSIDLALQKLKGDTMFAKAAAFSEGKATVKIDTAEIDGTAIAGILGVTPTTGSHAQASGTATIGTSPVTVVAAPPSGGTFAKDLGVRDATGALMTPVTSGSEAIGKYSIDATTGTYKFAASQGLVTYSFDYSQTTGNTASVVNTQAGAAPTFEVRGYHTFQGSQFGHVLYAVVIPKLGLAFKNGAFSTTKLEGEAIDDGTGRIFDLYTK